MKNRILNFPPDQSIGMVLARAAGTNAEWTDFAEARGSLAIPLDKELKLSIDPTANIESEALDALDPSALSAFVWASTSKISDEHLAHIRHLTGLRGLALWETPIGDE